jgi:Holliday junction resolvasome RuvABC endonuclease subunit
MACIRVVGLDPSMAAFGISLGILNLDTGEFDLQCIEVVDTASSKTKQVRKNSDDLERARKIQKQLIEMLPGADLVCVEIPVGSQSARAMASYGMCIGILASINIPMIQLTATELKLAATGNKNATKKDMIDWATSTYPDTMWYSKKVKGQRSFTNKNEHVADATAAIHAGVKTDEFKLMRLAFNAKE